MQPEGSPRVVVMALVLAVLILVTACHTQGTRPQELVSDECRDIIVRGSDGSWFLRRQALTPGSVDLVNRCLAELGIDNVRASRDLPQIPVPNHT